jgi:hypothetical protein
MPALQVRTGQSHVAYFMLSKFVEMLGTAGDAAVTAALTRVCALFALSDLVGGQQWTGLLELDQVGRSR